MKGGLVDALTVKNGGDGLTDCLLILSLFIQRAWLISSFFLKAC